MKPTITELASLLKRQPSLTDNCPYCGASLSKYGRFGICKTGGCRKYLDWVRLA